ncbi:MAG TPA: twin-arginine translocase subunit TatC [Opitutaceae bacterium]|nr:twin-arginine translocase subunit TatC [Opitutaceae bacterium]
MNPPDDRQSASEPSGSPRERVMGFWDHLDELRGTIIKSASVFIFFAALIGFYLTQFYHVLMWPLHRVAAEYPRLVIELGTTTPMEGMNVIIEMCMLGGLMLSAPFILFFAGQFVAPALTQKEMKAVLPMCTASFLLFLSGAAFGFFVLTPSALRVTIEINQGFGWAFRWTVGSYYTILTRLVLGVGGVFQFPLLVVLLVWLGFLSTPFLRKYRRHAVVLFFVVSAIVTPSTEPLSQTFLALPLCILYELAIVVSARVEKRRERSGAVVLLALLSLLPARRPRLDHVGLGRHA